MMVREDRVRIALALCCAVIAACRTGPAQRTAAAAHDSVAPAAAHDTSAERARIAFAHGLPRLDGNRLAATIVEVTYGPGGASSPHSHPCPVIGYVVEGAYRTQVQGEPEAVYSAGQSFYEAPNSAHLVSANASRDKPVRFLAYFTCDRHTPLSVALPETQHAGER